MDRKRKNAPGSQHLLEATFYIAGIVGLAIIGANHALSTVPRVQPVQRVLMPGVLRDGNDSQTKEQNRSSEVRSEREARPVDRIHHGADLHSLVKSIARVESNGNPRAIGDGGRAVGLLQIWPITVRDVNRILGEDYYTLEDRYDPGKSIEMFMVKSKHYAKHTGDWSAEGIARRWNGNPEYGHKQQATLKYWRKVKVAYGTQ